MNSTQKTSDWKILPMFWKFYIFHVVSYCLNSCLLCTIFVQIGLNSWSTLLDANGQSAHTYAAMRNNHSYNELVACKLSDRRNGQISLSVGGLEIVEQDNSRGLESVRQRSSCARCSVVATRHYGTRITRSQGVLHRPYIHSMLVIAAVCVCVCLFFRGAPKVGLVPPFKWENLDFGPI